VFEQESIQVEVTESPKIEFKDSQIEVVIDSPKKLETIIQKAIQQKKPIEDKKVARSPIKPYKSDRKIIIS
jgi:hypothetical protein